MRSPVSFAAFLLFAGALAFARTKFESEFVRVTLPDGWKAEPTLRRSNIVIVEESDRTVPPRKTEMISFNKERVGCSIRLNEMPAGEFTLFAERILRAELAHAGIEPGQRFKRWADRDGHGAAFIRRHPYDIVTATRVFYFYQDGFACLLRVQSSDQDRAVAEKNLNAALSDVEATLRTFEIRQP